MSKAQFEEADLCDELPPPGFYRSTITTARFKRSAHGNRMVQVVYVLKDVAPGHDRIAEYFVLEGVSPRGQATARRRLVELYRACDLEPRQGDEITPEALVGAALEVKVEPDEWDGQARLRVVGHRRAGSLESEPVPF